VAARAQDSIRVTSRSFGWSHHPPLVSTSPSCVTDARRSSTAPAIVERVRGEFTEMPGLSPTLAQAARLFGLQAEECRGVLELLLQEEFLRCGSDGQYRIR
jgi:hypothetical protein